MRELEVKVLLEAQKQVCALMSEEWDNIIEARANAAIEAGKQMKEKFNYSVGLKVIMEPKGGEVDVTTTIAYTVAHKNETETTTVDDHPQLPGMGDESPEED